MIHKHWTEIIHIHLPPCLFYRHILSASCNSETGSVDYNRKLIYPLSEFSERAFICNIRLI